MKKTKKVEGIYIKAINLQVSQSYSRFCLIKIFFIAIFMLFIISTTFFGGCKQMIKQNDENGKLTINDIVYDVNKNSNYTVYVRENEKYVPYLVLTNDYNGNILLLRKYLLDNFFCIRDVDWEGSGGSYYPGSDVDSFLNNEYLFKLTQSTQDIIFETDIIVTTEKSLQMGGGFSEIEIIRRKIFILSATELGVKSGMANIEGKLLKYFKDADNLLATDENHEPQIYWMRTPYLVDDIKTWSVSYDGSWGSCPVALKQMIRPAFCVNMNTVIKERSDIIDNKIVYVLD